MLNISDLPFKVLIVILLLVLIFGCFLAVRIIRAFLKNDPLNDAFPQNTLLFYFTYVTQTQNHLSGSYMIIRTVFTIVNPVLSCLAQHLSRCLGMSTGLLALQISFLGCLSKFKPSLYMKIQPTLVKTSAVVLTSMTILVFLIVNGKCGEWNWNLICQHENGCFKTFNASVGIFILTSMVLISITLMSMRIKRQVTDLFCTLFNPNNIQPIDTISLSTFSTSGQVAEIEASTVQPINPTQGKLVVELSTHQKGFLASAIANIILLYVICTAFDSLCEDPIFTFISAMINTTGIAVYWILANSDLKEFAKKKWKTFLLFGDYCH